MAEDLKLAWLVANTKGDKRISRRQLLDAVHFSGRNPSRKEMQVWKVVRGLGGGTLKLVFSFSEGKFKFFFVVVLFLCVYSSFFIFFFFSFLLIYTTSHRYPKFL